MGALSATRAPLASPITTPQPLATLAHRVTSSPTIVIRFPHREMRTPPAWDDHGRRPPLWSSTTPPIGPNVVTSHTTPVCPPQRPSLHDCTQCTPPTTDALCVHVGASDTSSLPSGGRGTPSSRLHPTHRQSCGCSDKVRRHPVGGWLPLHDLSCLGWGGLVVMLWSPCLTTGRPGHRNGASCVQSWD